MLSIMEMIRTDSRQETVLQSTKSRHMCREVPQKIEPPQRVDLRLLDKVTKQLEKLPTVEAFNQIFLRVTSSTSRRERLLVTERTSTTARTSKKLPVRSTQHTSWRVRGV